jgi:cytochrome c553
MKKLIKATITGAVAVNVSVIVIVQSFWGPEAYHGNVERGAKIAAWGTSKGVASCSSCHGYDGVGNGDSRVPRLAGQSSAYLAQQLEDYANGQRNNILMVQLPCTAHSSDTFSRPSWPWDLATQFAPIRWPGES